MKARAHPEYINETIRKTIHSFNMLVIFLEAKPILTRHNAIKNFDIFKIQAVKLKYKENTYKTPIMLATKTRDFFMDLLSNFPVVKSIRKFIHKFSNIIKSKYATKHLPPIHYKF